MDTTDHFRLGEAPTPTSAPVATDEPLRGWKHRAQGWTRFAQSAKQRLAKHTLHSLLSAPIQRHAAMHSGARNPTLSDADPTTTLSAAATSSTWRQGG